MTPEPRHPPIVPSYGTASLADLSSSMLASLDPGAPESQNVLGLTPTRRACLLIVDGLGWELLRDHPAAAPFLSELARNSKPITSGFPSTTVTSLGSICTGSPPGQHGILGYQVIIPGRTACSTGCAGIRGSIRGSGSRGPPSTSGPPPPASRPCTWPRARSAAPA
jgi:hypothetical protein